LQRKKFITKNILLQAFLDKYRLQNIVFILLIAYLLITRILLIFSYSIDLDGAEFIFVYHVQRLIDHKPLYNNPTEFPFLACLFVPVYLYILKGVLSLFSTSSQHDLHFMYVVSRAFSFVLFILQISIFITYLRRRFQSSWRNIFILTAVYLLLISGHMYVVRPDALKFLLFTIGFILLIEYEFFKQHIFYLPGFLVVAVLNVFTKQDTIVYSCILIGCMFLVTRKIKYIALLVSFLLVVVLVFLSMVHIFGNNFYTNVILFNFQTIDDVFTSINMLLVIFSLGRISPLLLIVFVMLYKHKNALQKDAMVLFLIITAMAFLAVSHLFILRAGSNINYAYESIFLLLFLFSMLLKLDESTFKLSGKAMIFPISYVLFLFATNTIIHNYRYNFKREEELKATYYKNIETNKQIKSVINNELVFYPNMEYGLFGRNNNLIYGYDYNIGRFISLVMPIEINTRLTFFDSKKYDDYFKNGKVKYIVSQTNKADFMQKNYPNYTFQDSIGNLSVYAFK